VYPKPGQDGPPLGVRWFSEGLGGTRGTMTFALLEVAVQEGSSFR
jgi:hypothetical protein